jgi:hypothetical protein
MVMKKICIGIFLLFGICANAQMATDANTNTKNIFSIFYQEKQYKKIENTQVPIDVLRQASFKYTGFALNKAYSSGEGEYKLMLKKQNKFVNAIFKSNGEFIKEVTN